MIDKSNILFYTEKYNAEEFSRRAKDVGFDLWTREVTESGLIVFRFDSLDIEEAKKLLDATGDLNTKSAVGS
jgi:hypothetical protein